MHMKYHLLALATAALAIATSGAALANHHEEGHDGHTMEKMEDGTMKCCMTDKDGKKACHMMEGDKMDHSKMDHSKMDHSKMDQGKMDHSTMDHGNMDHGNMAQPETPDAEPN
jgi:uncharacterized protein involved in copper resistance